MKGNSCTTCKPLGLRTVDETKRGIEGGRFNTDYITPGNNDNY